MLDTRDITIAQALAAPKKFSTALYLGPGLEVIAKALSDRYAEGLVAYTTPVAKKALLASASKGLSRIDVHTALLSDSDEPATLQEFNIKGYASLRPATGLRQIFPGLRETRQTSINTITPQKALQQAALTGADNLLILGATGFETEVMDAVLPSDGPYPFSRIILLLPELTLYAGGSDGTALAARLEKASYRCSWTDPSDADMPIAAFDLDHARLADRAALAERDRDIVVLTDRLERLTSDLKEVQAQRNAAKSEAESLGTALETLQAQHDTACAKLGEVETSLETAQTEKESIAQKLEEAHSRATELEQQIETLEQARYEAAAEREETRAALSNLRSEHDMARTKFGDAKARQKAESIQQSNAKSDQDLTLALRLQGLREADLVELKERYQSLKQKNDHLSDLLRTTLHTLDFLRGQKRGGKKAAKRT